MRFRIDWASLIAGSKVTVFALFYFVFAGNFPNTSPLRAYIWTGDLTEGFLRYQFFGGGIFGEANFRNFLSPAIFHSSSILLLLGTTRTEISACKPIVNLLRLLESS